MKDRQSLRTAILPSVCTAVWIVLAAAAGAQTESSYSFVRVLDGYADLIQSGTGSVAELTENYPVVVGDQLRISQRARLETVLADGTLLRAGGNTEVKFDRIRNSGDTHDTQTLLQLLQGEIQLSLAEQQISTSEAFQVDTANASIYLRDGGDYRLVTDGRSWTELVVRSGYAEVVTERGSTIVRADEQCIVDGSRMASAWVEAAGPEDALERWGRDLIAQAQPLRSGEVAPSLSYAAAPLQSHGSWTVIAGRSAWMPRVGAGWRPYHSGWWVTTPSGLTWVSTEPWGWVTYHYGIWDYAAGFGWVWFPGYAYTPGAVYWYWGPSYVGWIPAGYYTRYYGHRYPYPQRYLGSGWSVGIHGWAGGPVSVWGHWNFCRYEHFGHRGGHSYYRTASELSHSGAFRDGVPRGVIATDTRYLKSEILRSPEKVMSTLAHRSRESSGARSDLTALPDVTSFVARERSLSESVRRAIAPVTDRQEAGSPKPLTGGTRVPITSPSSDRLPRSTLSRGLSSRWIERDGTSTRPTPDFGRTGPDTTTGALPRPLIDQTRGGMQRPAPQRTWESDRWRQEVRSRVSTAPPTVRSFAPRTQVDPGSSVVRRVWDGVRSYREQGRDSGFGSPPTTRSRLGTGVLPHLPSSSFERPSFRSSPVGPSSRDSSSRGAVGSSPGRSPGSMSGSSDGRSSGGNSSRSGARSTRSRSNSGG